jgi:hypothetical protein
MKSLSATKLLFAFYLAFILGGISSDLYKEFVWVSRAILIISVIWLNTFVLRNIDRQIREE